MAMTPNSHTSAHSVTTTVAPFRAWRGSRLAVARGPEGATIEAKRGIIRGLAGKCNRPGASSLKSSLKSRLKSDKTSNGATSMEGLFFTS